MKTFFMVILRGLSNQKTYNLMNLEAFDNGGMGGGVIKFMKKNYETEMLPVIIL